MSSYVPGLSGGVDAEVSVNVAFGPITVEGTDVVGITITCGVFGVRRTGGSGENSRGGSSSSVAVTVSSGDGSVEIDGSVPKKMYVNGVWVTVTSITVLEVLYRYTSRTRQIPMTEKMPIKAGGSRLRSNAGGLSLSMEMRNQWRVEMSPLTS